MKIPPTAFLQSAVLLLRGSIYFSEVLLLRIKVL